MRVSVIIPAWNAERTLGQCLKALSEQTAPPLETIVVDDFSTDGTKGVAESFGVKVLCLARNTGPAIARNRGAEAASGDVLLFLDADVVVPPALVEKVTNHFSDPRVSAVQTLYTPGCPVKGLVTRYQNYYYHHSLNRLRATAVAVFATWCAAVRREAFLGLGGFNERIPEPTVEDEEFGYAVADSGGVILLEKSAQVTHLAEYSFGAFAARRMRMAAAQAKSGWRQVKRRLLARYINVSETGTHHSRWVVLSIILTILGWLSLLSTVVTGFAGPVLFAGFLSAALICHAGFFTSAARLFGAGMIPGFAVMCIADMTILGIGIGKGTVQFLLGRRY